MNPSGPGAFCFERLLIIVSVSLIQLYSDGLFFYCVSAKVVFLKEMVCFMGLL